MTPYDPLDNYRRDYSNSYHNTSCGDEVMYIAYVLYMVSCKNKNDKIDGLPSLPPPPRDPVLSIHTRLLAIGSRQAAILQSPLTRHTCSL